MSVVIHPSAEVHQSAKLGDNVRVEAGALIEADCIIGSNTVIDRNSIIWQGTQLGDNNRIFPFCSLGGEPQDKKYAGEEAPLIIGSGNVIREYCFINKGTAANNKTSIGDNNLIMAYVHVAHDCIIGSNTIIANLAQFAGHAAVGDGAVIGGGVLLRQFCRFGAGVMIGGGETVRHDVAPYALMGEGVISVNSEGMRRAGCSAEEISAMRRAYKLLYRAQLPLQEAIDAIAALPPTAQLSVLLDFLRLPDLNLIRPRADKH